MRYQEQTNEIEIGGTHQEYPVPDYDHQGVVDIDDREQVIVTSSGDSQ